MSALPVQRLKRNAYQRGIVTCAKCGKLIPIQRLNALADEFSVQCPHCAARGMYSKRAIRIEDMPERRKKPRR